MQILEAQGPTSVCDVMDTVEGNGQGDKCSILDDTVCFSQSVNTLGKVMNPIIPRPQTMGK